MMENFVVIGANSFQYRLIVKARQMGYCVHAFAWECGDVGEKAADVFHPVSIVEKEKILEICRGLHPVGVASIASDLAVTTVNYVAENLGLCCNSYADSELCTNKFAMRSAFRKNGIPVPRFISVSEPPEAGALEGFCYPLIVKPTDRSGSRGITKITEFGQIASAVKSAVSQSFEKRAVIEEFIEGDEYSCECVSYEGRHSFLAFTKKYTTGAPHFIETGHVQPAGIPECLQDKIKDTVFKALSALNIKNGASHTEFKLTESGEVRIIEIGARMGGDCIGSDLVYLSTGVDFVRAVVDIACGRRPDLTREHLPQKATVRFIFDDAGLCELERVKQDTGKHIQYISDMNRGNIGAVTDSSNRVGYYIYTE